MGQGAIALTDKDGVYGAVRFQQACQDLGLHSIIGSEVTVDGHPLVFLARSQKGFFNLNRLLTAAHFSSSKIANLRIEEIGDGAEDLICLTGGREGRLWDALSRGNRDEAKSWLRALLGTGFAQVYVEIFNGVYPYDSYVMKSAYSLAREMGVPAVATNDVRFALPEDYKRFDLLTCVRLKLKVTQQDAVRPHNSEAYLKSEEEISRLIPFPEIIEETAKIADSCRVDLLPGTITTPAAEIPAGYSPRAWLAKKCSSSIVKKYPGDSLPPAQAQLDKEIGVISQLGLDEFFLVVAEVVEEARRRKIRCAGRGSAANSIVAYLLGITAVDPIRHNLLFERFLHQGRKGTPDIDVDFDAERRPEIITWMEERFGIDQTAMTATLVTYRLHSAVRDVGKALGWPLADVDAAIRKIPYQRASHVREYRHLLVETLGESPLLELLLELVEGLEGCPRHLGLHVGGMVLSRTNINCFSPVQISANGVKMVQFDKIDVETLGLVKFDVLGLRMLATLSEATELLELSGEACPELSELPLDDEEVLRFIRTGRTLGVFQIESQGQMHLIASHQPTCFDDLITEIALFRPGPLQGGMVHPFVRRRKGEEPVTYDHPDLEEILSDTYGVILFQEQILEIAHKFAGMPLGEADDFRALMSKYRDREEMESMRAKFVSGAMNRGVPQETAQDVFDKVSNFVGYGFCRSHAAAFAQTVYQSAWLKHFFPAAFLAAVMQHRPGMYHLMTLEEEAKRCGVEVRGPHINRSEARYSLERRSGGEMAIRKPLSSVKAVSEEIARRIVWCRFDGPFPSIGDLISRVFVPRSVLEALAGSGALDPIAGSRRKAYWEIGVLERRLSEKQPPGQMTLFELPAVSPEEIPELSDLTALEQFRWDWKTQGSSQPHPLTITRRYLNHIGVEPIQSLFHPSPWIKERQGGPMATVAGLAILRQKPPTAKGMMFLTLEDETGFVQCVIAPQVQKRYFDNLMEPFVIVRGKVQGLRHWRCVLVQQAWALDRFQETGLGQATGTVSAHVQAHARKAAP